MGSYETRKNRPEEEAERAEDVRDLAPESPIENVEAIKETIADTTDAIGETVYGDPMSFARSMIGEGRSAMLGGFTCALTELAPGALLTAEVIGACEKSRDRGIEKLRGEISDIDK
jgi:hypothetical protein